MKEPPPLSPPKRWEGGGGFLRFRASPLGDARLDPVLGL